MAEPVSSSEPEEFAEFDAAFEGALARIRDSGPAASLLFSGGVDSSLLAWELRALKGLALVTIGRAGSPDIAAAQNAAARIGLPWSPHVIERAEALGIAQLLASELEGSNGPKREVAIAFALALSRVRTDRAVTGQGVDELFLGYARYSGLSGAEAARRSEADLRELAELEWPRAERIARRLGHTLQAPFLDPQVVHAALQVPVERRQPSPVPKAWFRRWACHRGLPAELAGRPKRAFQYGARIHQMLGGK